MLIDPSGKTIHEVSYDLSWFNDDFKSQGGFTFEMIDLSKPCLGSNNFQFSISQQGGTPGQINSVNGEIFELANNDI